MIVSGCQIFTPRVRTSVYQNIPGVSDHGPGAVSFANKIMAKSKQQSSFVPVGGRDFFFFLLFMIIIIKIIVF